MLTQYEKPCIKIIPGFDAGTAELKALCSGIEEEMIPYEISPAEAGEAVELSFRAAEASRLSVGVGLCQGSAALHYGKLLPKRPLFSLSGEGFDRVALRKLGANAARLVKGIAFKE